MNDPTPTPDDDLIRRSLQREAEGVRASDELLDRTLAAAARRTPVRASRRMLLVAAVIAAVAVGAAVALAGDGDQKVDASNDPTTTTTTPEGDDVVEVHDDLDFLGTLFPCEPGHVVTAVLLGSDATDEQLLAVTSAIEAHGPVRTETVTRDEVVAAGGDPALAVGAWFSDADEELAARGDVSDLPGVTVVTSTRCDEQTTEPTLVALVREDGWLVVVDLQTGAERELYSGGDPEAPPSGQEEGGPQFIDAVDLSADGAWVYFSTCCEPASGMSFRIPVTGGEPEEVAIGAHPRVHPDGQVVATSRGDYVAVTPVGRLEGGASMDAECCPDQLAWSPDGRQLAAVQHPAPDGQVHQVLLFDWDGTNLTPADVGKPDNPGSFVSWLPDGMLNIVSGGPVDDDRGLAQDDSYEWLLWVDQDGQVLAQAGHESGDRTPIAGLPEALSADW